MFRGLPHRVFTVLITMMFLAGLSGYQPVAAQDSTCIPGYDATSYDWGTAGPSPCSLDEVVETLDFYAIDGGEVKVYLTAINFTPGNPTPIAWSLATSGSEAKGNTFGANYIPKGTVVDYDPRASVLDGEYDYVDFREDWRRALLKSDGSFTGLKATVYWTPVNWGDLTPTSYSTMSSGQPAPSTSAGTGATEGEVTIDGDSGASPDDTATPTACPTTVEQVIALFTAYPTTLGNSANWTAYPQEAGFQYTGTLELATINMGKVNDSALHTTPYELTTAPFTWYPCAT